MDYSVFDKLLDAVLIVDCNKDLIYSNEAFANIIGVSLKRLKPGKRASDFIKLSDKDVFLMPEGTWGKDEPTLYKEFDFESYKGNKGQVSLSIQPIQTAGERHWIHFIRDMSLEVLLQKKYRKELGQKEEVIKDLRKAQAELQKYSKNLEIMVEERTVELKKSNQFVHTMVNSLGQGLMVFNEDNECLPIYTKACEELFNTRPGGKKIYDVLGFSKDKQKSFQKWSDSVFSGILPFEDLVGLAPKTIDSDDGNTHIGLEFHPMLGEDKNLMGVVTVATDKTQEMAAKKEAKKNEEYANMIIKLVKNKNQFLAFVKDAKKIVRSLVERTKPEAIDKFELEPILLDLHSLKGGAGVYSIIKIYDLTHEYETLLDPYKGDRSVKALKELMPSLNKKMISLETTLENYLAEFKNFLGEAIVDGEHRVEIKSKGLVKFSEKLLKERDIKGLYREFIQGFVKEPVSSFFKSYSDLVETLAQRQNKKIKPIEFVGGETPIKSDHYSALFSTLVHVFTNAVVHGLEDPNDRILKGKEEYGHIKVTFHPYINRSGKRLKIMVEDDGKGVDPLIIRKKLQISNPHDPALKLSDEEIVLKIFDDSFSTLDSVTTVAGRGVGMSAVKSVVADMSGKLEFESFKGHGTRLVMDFKDP